MGVCGYTYSEVQQMPIDALARSITAKRKHDAAPWNALFTALFGAASESEPAQESARTFSPELFDALFA